MKVIGIIKQYFAKIILIVLAMILLTFLLNTGRKMYIMSNLSHKAEGYVNSMNYCQITSSLNGDKYSKREIIVLGEKKKTTLTQLDENGLNKEEIFAIQNEDANNNYIANKYFYNNGKKIAELQAKISYNVSDITNIFYVENWYQLLKYSIDVSIQKTNFNGKECFYITNLESPYAYSGSLGMYVDKETGLVMGCIYKQNGDNNKYYLMNYEYKFDTVGEECFIEPNIEEYDVKNNP